MRTQLQPDDFPKCLLYFPRSFRGVAALSLALLWGWAWQALALDPTKPLTQYPIASWQVEDSLPQNSVTSVVQTPEGYLWLGTQEGLVRFDGAAFTVFDKDNTPALVSNNIRALYVTRDGALWVGTNGGGLVRQVQGRFTSYAAKDGLPSGVIYALCEDDRGDLWVGTYGGGLSRFRGGRFEALDAAEGPGPNVEALCAGRDGVLWVGTNGRGLFRLKDGLFERFSARGGFPIDVVSALHEDSRGTLWIGTRGGGLWRYAGGRFQALGNPIGPTNHNLPSIYEDREGTLWIATMGGGLIRMRDGRFEALTSKEGLTSDMVRSFCEDREGSLWVGFEAGGLCRLSNGKFTVFSTREGLSGNIATGVMQSKDGGLWVGTYGGGLNRWKDGMVRTYTSADGLPSDLIWAVCETRGGDLWVGTDGWGLCRLRDGKATTFTKKDGLNSDIISALFEDSRGALWIGSNGGGLCRMTEGRITNISLKEGLANDAVHVVREDSRGGIWVGTDGGLGHLTNGRVQMITTREGLSHDIVSAIHEDAEGTIWVGTVGGGLNRLRDGKVTRFTKKDGLYDDVVFLILEDDAGNLWMSCNKGVFRVRKGDLLAFAEGRLPSIPCTSYGAADGMRSAECNGGFMPAGCRLADGRFSFPTMAGVATVDPRGISSENDPPPILVEKVRFGKSAEDFPESVTVPPGTKSIEIRYTGLGLLAPQKVRFKYRLEGFDSEWVEAGSRRVAYYTNLPPGTYTFWVTCASNGGRWNPTAAKVSVRMRPRFFQTPLFYILSGALLALAGALIYSVSLWRIRARQRHLEHLVEARTRELQEANRTLGERTLQLEEMNLELEKRSTQDGLTGAANRRLFDERLESEWRRSSRAGLRLSLILLDVDYFKNFNDTAGHQRGDECLKRVAGLLLNSYQRAGDLVARIGGDEFCIILSNTSEEEAATQAENLRASVEALGIEHHDSAVSALVTASLGVAGCLPGTDESAENLLAAADQALYTAKKEGRNRVRVAPKPRRAAS